VLDVTKPLPFAEVQFIFAEHFLEHLPIMAAQRVLRECRRVLASDGVLRFSTPNLDWVWATQYHPGQWSSDQAAVMDCFALNRGFYGWDHRFLYNLQTLTALVRDAGFRDVVSCTYGDSEHPELRSLERHERSADTAALPHVLIVEASGTAQPTSELDGLLPDFRRDTDMRWHMLQYSALTATRLIKRILRFIP
jgi:SAM-dependent methyltransferase